MVQLVKELVNSREKKLIEIRHHIHQNPELSFEEVNTAAFIRELLKKMGITDIKEIGTSTVAVLKGDEPGPCIAFRADIDALPVMEDNDLPYKSKNPGVMHACGHDTHTACLLCMADILSEHRELVKGSIKFIFQAAEEKLPGGAKAICEAGVMNDVDEVFGFHCSSQYPLGQVTVSKGASSAAIGIYEATIKGYGGHGSSPHKAKNPVPVACMAASAVNQIIPEKKDPADVAVLTVSYFNAGQYPNIITDKATFGGNVRTRDNELILSLLDRIHKTCDGIAQGFGLECEFSQTIGYPATINSEKQVNIVKDAVAEMGYQQLDNPIALGGEDFAYYVLEKPGAYFTVGMADPERPVTSSPHHNCKFQLDERGLRIALELELKTYLNAVK